MKMKEEDAISHIKYAETHDNIIFFTNKGKAYQIKAYEIAESSRTAKGTAVVNLLNIEAGEEVESFIVYNKKEKAGFVFLATRNGTVKKTNITEFENIRKNGMIAIKLEEKDELVWSLLSTGDNHVLIVTKEGKAIKFKEEEVRPMGRATMGVRGIKIGSTDRVIGMDLINHKDNPDVFVIMENGLGKRTAINQFPLQGRGGLGVKVAKVTDKTGSVVTAQIIPINAEEVIITSKHGQVVRIHLKTLPQLGRDTQGVILMRFSGSADKVSAATCLEASNGEEK
jgi:DNA gyrase subunit A